MIKVENDKYKEDMVEMIKIYRGVKHVIDDIIDSLKIIIIIFGIMLWICVLTTVVGFINDLNIIPNSFVGLVYILLAAGGSLYILLKMRDL